MFQAKRKQYDNILNINNFVLKPLSNYFGFFITDFITTYYHQMFSVQNLYQGKHSGTKSLKNGSLTSICKINAYSGHKDRNVV